jgi:hypothetical protein
LACQNSPVITFHFHLSAKNAWRFIWLLQEPGFWLSHEETGFLNQDFYLDAKAIAETRFLASHEETGFLNQDFCLDAKAIAETRFLTPASH